MSEVLIEFIVIIYWYM